MTGHFEKTDPEAFALEWSFNGRFYALLSFFHGLSIGLGQDVKAHDAFKGTVYHVDIFGPNGALYDELEGLAADEAEARLLFAERAMEKLRINERRFLFEKAGRARDVGLLLASSFVVGSVAAAIYLMSLGMQGSTVAFVGMAMPFLIGTAGKSIVRFLWNRKARRMGSFADALPWRGNSNLA